MAEAVEGENTKAFFLFPPEVETIALIKGFEENPVNREKVFGKAREIARKIRADRCIVIFWFSREGERGARYRVVFYEYVNYG